jgi:hypothetical protein
MYPTTSIGCLCCKPARTAQGVPIPASYVMLSFGHPWSSPLRLMSPSTCTTTDLMQTDASTHRLPDASHASIHACMGPHQGVGSTRGQVGTNIPEQQHVHAGTRCRSWWWCCREPPQGLSPRACLTH